MLDDLTDRYAPHWWRVYTELLGIPADQLDGYYHQDAPAPCCGKPGTFKAFRSEAGDMPTVCNGCGGPKGGGGILFERDLAAKVLKVPRFEAQRRIDEFLGFPQTVGRLTPELLAGLQAVDSDWRLIPCDGRKRPINPVTGDLMLAWALRTYDADGIGELAKSPYVRAVGLVLGETSGVIALDFDGDGSTGMFLKVYGVEWSRLPRTVAWTSGRPNRRQMAFRVPSDMWPYLRGRRFFNTPDGRTVLELRGAGHQSVIAGEHPDTNGYEWIPGRSPADLQVADAPEWLLAPLMKSKAEPTAAEHQPSTSADRPRALDLLAHIPASDADNYDTWLNVGMALHSVDSGLLHEWKEWSKSSSKFDEEVCLSKWISFKGSGVTIGTLHFLAERAGYRYRRPPEERQRPGDAQGEAADVEAAEPPPLTFRELLALVLEAVRAADEDGEMEARAEIMARFRRTDGQITAALFRLLSQQEQESGNPQQRPDYRSVDLSKVSGIDWLLEGFVPANDQALLYAPAGAGKTTAALGMAFAVTDGSGFLDRATNAPRGNVLLIASDSGTAPLIRSIQEMGRGDDPAISADTTGSRLHVWAHDTEQAALAWEASLRGCLRLLEFVQSEQITLVVIDSCKAVTSKADLNYCDNGQVTALLTFFKEVLCQHCAVVWINHDGTGEGQTAGAKAWKEVPSAVHSIEIVPEGMDDGGGESGGTHKGKPVRFSTKLRSWKVRKCRQGTAREFMYRIDDETGCLAVCQTVEVIRDCRAAIVDVLAQALNNGKASLHSRAIVEELQAKFRYSQGTIRNGLTRVTGGKWPEVVRVPSLRGHYRLAPKVADALTLDPDLSL